MILLCGCSSPVQTEKPHPLIPPQTMREILTDYYQLEATLRVCERERMENVAAYGRQQWDSLLHKYRITNEVWEKNFCYYMTQSELSDTLLSKVTDRLAAMEAAKSDAMRKAADTMPEPEFQLEESGFEEIIF